jgi:hypothetical protein
MKPVTPFWAEHLNKILKIAHAIQRMLKPHSGVGASLWYLFPLRYRSLHTPMRNAL